MADAAGREGMGRFGINVEYALGISVTRLRALGRDVGKDHRLALELWDSGIHEAQILATIVDEPKLVTREQLESWANDFDSWDLVDQCCGNLVSRTPLAVELANEWSQRDEEFVKRAGFSTMAYLATRSRRTSSSTLKAFLDRIEEEAGDPRNFVKKAVNWALRQIGKRDAELHALALEVADRLRGADDRAGRWVGSNAYRELTSPKVLARL
jgi:3-methyladenine DNA glycosylase AlkD